MDGGVEKQEGLWKRERLVLPGQLPGFRDTEPDKQVTFSIFTLARLKESLQQACSFRIAERLQSTANIDSVHKGALLEQSIAMSVDTEQLYQGYSPAKAPEHPVETSSSTSRIDRRRAFGEIGFEI